MKKITLSLFLISIIMGVFVFYSCSQTDDDNMSVSERIARFCSDYNSNNDGIKNNFVQTASGYNSDIKTWNIFFGGTDSTHESISYSITSINGSIVVVSINCFLYKPGNFTFMMVQVGDNNLIASITKT